MGQVIKHLIGKNVDVYVYDIMVKSLNLFQHLQDLSDVLSTLWTYNLRLNPKKYVFGVDGDKFLRFMLTHKEIEANPKKWKMMINTRNPNNVKEVQRLIERKTTISQFLPKLMDKARHMIKLLRKSIKFVQDDECHARFKQLNKYWHLYQF